MTDEVVRAADAVITMGCGDACPIYPGKRYEDWELDDPAEPTSTACARIRDEIDERVRELLAELTRPAARRVRDDRGPHPATRLAPLLAAELVGTFALVFAGCGAIMVDAQTEARSASRRSAHASGS